MTVPPAEEPVEEHNPFAPPTGEPGPYGYYPGSAEPRPAVLNPKRQRLVWLKVSLSVVVLIVALGLLFFGDSIFSGSSDTLGDSVAPGPIGAGDCLSIEQLGMQLDPIMMPFAPCADPTANFKVAVTEDAGKQCPDPAYQDLAAANPDRELCLMPNVHQNDCVAIGGDTPVEKVDCAAGGSTLLVTKMLDGVADVHQCASPKLAFAYSQPATTICLGPLPKPS